MLIRKKYLKVTNLRSFSNYFFIPFVLILLACFDLLRPLDRSDGCSSLQQCDSSDAGFIVNEIKLILNYRNKFLSLLIFIFFCIKMFFLMKKLCFHYIKLIWKEKSSILKYYFRFPVQISWQHSLHKLMNVWEGLVTKQIEKIHGFRYAYSKNTVINDDLHTTKARCVYEAYEQRRATLFCSAWIPKSSAICAKNKRF